MTVALPEWVTRHQQDGIAFERRAERRVVGGLRSIVVDATDDMTRTYVRLTGGVDKPLPPLLAPNLRRELVQILVDLATAMASEVANVIAALGRIIRRGLRIGVAQARETTGAPQVQAAPSQALADAPHRLGYVLLEDVAAARQLAEFAPLAKYGDIATVAGTAQQAVTHAEQTTRWVANRAVNEGAGAVAEDLGVARIWVGEADACLHCYAYFGEVAEPGQPFRAGLTFYRNPAGVEKPISTEPVDGPPLHPNCRCSTKPYLGLDRHVGVDFSTALKREAQRAVLRGDSGHASNPAMLRAADALLQAGLSGLPETVKKRARRAIQAGRFPDRGGPVDRRTSRSR